MTTRAIRPAIVLGSTLALVGIQVAGQGADPILGTWVLNVVRSTFNHD